MMQAEWLHIVMQGSFNEIYILDCETLHFLHVSDAACLNLQYPLPELVSKTLQDIVAPQNKHSLLQMLQSLDSVDESKSKLDADLVRRDGTRYPVEFRLFRSASAPSPVYIAIGTDVSSQQETAKELGLSKSLFRATVSNTPGLVYQFQSRPDGTVSFTYLSEGCQALLGLSADQLQDEPEHFLDLILPEDRQSYLESMAASSHDQKGWNWEGRIWIDAWKDIKWINLRATPLLLADKNVQWNGIMTNITQSKLEEFEIKHSRARLAELSAHIEHVKELERTNIAREVHDDLGGNLTAIKMALALLTSRLPKGSKELLEKAAYVDSLVDRTIESAHRIASNLRPSILDFGIVAALEWQTEEFEKQVGIPCEFSSNAKEIDLHPDQATAVFRIFQEALTNIAKHASATNVTVKLSLSRGSIKLKIIDNGKGIATAERLKPQSFGIRGMIERASSLGGKLSITPTNGGGSTITIKIPQK
jgi:two-component system, NarL family, sensor histidine kinase UhpB